MNIQVTYDENEISTISQYYDAVGRKAARSEISPILIEAIKPIVDKAKDILSPHNKSMALTTSLSARTGSGDRPGTISAFAAPTATTNQLRRTWGSKTRSTNQKRQFYRDIKASGKKGRTKIFYADYVHQGHKLVKKGRVVGNVDPIPFSAQAVEQVGDQQADIAANRILDKILED